DGNLVLDRVELSDGRRLVGGACRASYAPGGLVAERHRAVVNLRGNAHVVGAYAARIRDGDRAGDDIALLQCRRLRRVSRHRRRIVKKAEEGGVRKLQAVIIDAGADAGVACRQVAAVLHRDVVGDLIFLNDIRRLDQVVVVDDRGGGIEVV